MSTHEAKHAEVKDNEVPTLMALLRGLATLITKDTLERAASINKDPTFYIMKYYITQTIVEVVDGRLTGREVVLTRADAKVDPDSARLQNVKLFKSKLQALGIENLHVNKYDKKRYNKLVREQNKHRKEVKLTVADIAEMTKQAVEADLLTKDCDNV